MGKSKYKNEKRKGKRESKLKKKKNRKDKRRLAEMAHRECKRSKIVLNHSSGPDSLIDNKERNCKVIIKTRNPSNVVRDEAIDGGKIKKRGKRNKLTIKERSLKASAGSSSRETSEEASTDESSDEETRGRTISLEKPCKQSVAKGSKTPEKNVHITLKSTAKKRTKKASFGKKEKVADKKEAIKSMLGEESEILLYKNGKEINESKSFAENRIKTNDVIEVRAAALCSVEASGNQGRHHAR